MLTELTLDRGCIVFFGDSFPGPFLWLGQGNGFGNEAFKQAAARRAKKELSENEVGFLSVLSSLFPLSLCPVHRLCFLCKRAIFSDVIIVSSSLFTTASLACDFL